MAHHCEGPLFANLTLVFINPLTRLTLKIILLILCYQGRGRLSSSLYICPHKAFFREKTNKIATSLFAVTLQFLWTRLNFLPNGYLAKLLNIISNGFRLSIKKSLPAFLPIIVTTLSNPDQTLESSW